MVLVLILYLGFLTTFSLIGREHFDLKSMAFILSKIFYGSTYLGFDYMNDIDPLLGPPLMYIFVTLSSILLMGSLTGKPAAARTSQKELASTIVILTTKLSRYAVKLLLPGDFTRSRGISLCLQRLRARSINLQPPYPLLSALQPASLAHHPTPPTSLRSQQHVARSSHSAFESNSSSHRRRHLSLRVCRRTRHQRRIRRLQRPSHRERSRRRIFPS